MKLSWYLRKLPYLLISKHHDSRFPQTPTFTKYSLFSYFLPVTLFNFDVATFLATIIFLAAAGNILVCVAIYTERSLRRIGNLFLASLAIADLFVSLLVMTFASVNDILGENEIWCSYVCVNCKGKTSPPLVERGRLVHSLLDRSFRNSIWIPTRTVHSMRISFQLFFFSLVPSPLSCSPTRSSPVGNRARQDIGYSVLNSVTHGSLSTWCARHHPF